MFTPSTKQTLTSTVMPSRSARRLAINRSTSFLRPLSWSISSFFPWVFPSCPASCPTSSLEASFLAWASSESGGGGGDGGGGGGDLGSIGSLCNASFLLLPALQRGHVFAVLCQIPCKVEGEIVWHRHRQDKARPPAPPTVATQERAYPSSTPFVHA